MQISIAPAIVPGKINLEKWKWNSSKLDDIFSAYQPERNLPISGPVSHGSKRLSWRRGVRRKRPRWGIALWQGTVEILGEKRRHAAHLRREWILDRKNSVKGRPELWDQFPRRQLAFPRSYSSLFMEKKFPIKKWSKYFKGKNMYNREKKKISTASNNGRNKKVEFSRHLGRRKANEVQRWMDQNNVGQRKKRPNMFGVKTLFTPIAQSGKKTVEWNFHSNSAVKKAWPKNHNKQMRQPIINQGSAHFTKPPMRKARSFTINKSWR